MERFMQQILNRLDAVEQQQRDPGGALPRKAGMAADN